MPTDSAAVLQLAEEIGKCIQDWKTEGTSLGETRRQDLVKCAERLAIAAREPEENLYFQATQTAQNAAIRIAISLSIFPKIPPAGDDGINARDLATTLHVDERLLVRIMRACTSTHLFHEVGPSCYTHNAFSSIFLAPSNRDMFQQMYDLLGRGVHSMPHFLASKEHRNPSDYRDRAFQYGHGTRLGFWEYLNEDPARARVFNNGMRSLAAVKEGGSVGPYPFGEKAGREEVGADDAVLVDVGGGRGQALEAIHAAYPALKGRMVLQDLHRVIEDAKAGGLASFIEPMAVSFFERQPVEGQRGKRLPLISETGAIIYYFRRVFHDWSDDVAFAILQNTTPAMGPRSRILIVDTVVPETGAPRQVALQDINMMCFGGMERTRLQWEALLGRADLRLKRIWTGEGSLQCTIEAMLHT